MLNHHLAGLFGLGSLAWAGHLVHVALPINKCLDLGLDPLAIPLPHAFTASPDRINGLFSGFNITNVLALNWADIHVLTFTGGVNPVTAGALDPGYRTPSPRHRGGLLRGRASIPYAIWDRITTI